MQKIITLLKHDAHTSFIFRAHEKAKQPDIVIV